MVQNTVYLCRQKQNDMKLRIFKSRELITGLKRAAIVTERGVAVIPYEWVEIIVEGRVVYEKRSSGYEYDHISYDIEMSIEDWANNIKPKLRKLAKDAGNNG